MNVLRDRNPDKKDEEISEEDDSDDGEEFSEDEDDIALKKNLKKYKGSL